MGDLKSTLCDQNHGLMDLLQKMTWVGGFMYLYPPPNKTNKYELQQAVYGMSWWFIEG